MNVVAIPVLKLNSKNNSILKSSFLYKNSIPDTVSFSGSYLSNQNKPNVKEAVDIGLEIYNNGIDSKSAEKIIKAKIPNIDIKLSNEKSYTERGEAVLDFNMGENFEPKEISLVIPVYPKSDNDKSKRIYSSTIAHEYTHILQLSSGEYASESSEICNGDSDYLKIIDAVGDMFFQIFDYEIVSNFAIDVFKNIGKLKAFENDELVVLEGNLTREKALKNSVFKNEVQFKKYIKRIFEEVYFHTMSYILKRPDDIDSKVVDIIEKKLCSDGPERIMDVITRNCGLMAKHETEAYTAESMFSKKILKTNKSLNIDIFPIYYELLQEAMN